MVRHPLVWAVLWAAVVIGWALVADDSKPGSTRLEISGLSNATPELRFDF
jgi:hypothetical protein